MKTGKRLSYSKMNRQFVCFEGDAGFHHYPDETTLMVSNSMTGNRSLTLNRTATEILEMCDGHTDIETISKRFQGMHNVTLEKAEESLTNLLNDCLSGKLLRLSEHAVDQVIVRTGSEQHYIPQRLSLELTTQCNQQCPHCYGDFGAKIGEDMNLPRLKSLLQGLIDNGIKALTITGGEPFLFKGIAEFMSWVLPEMELVGVISNGTCIRDDSFDILSKNKDKFTFQITMNGRPEYHDRFAGNPGAFDKVVASIRRLVDCGIRLRLAMNVNTENIGDIQFVADLAHEMGVANMAASVSHNIGREKSRRLNDPYFENKDHDNNIEIINLITKELAVARNRHPKLFGKPPDYSDMITAMQSPLGPGEDITKKMFTCGAGQRSVHLGADGKLHLCAIAEPCGFPSLGNLLQNSLDEIMTSPIAKAVAHISVPVPAICNSQCEHFAFCGGCIVRGFTKYRENKDGCPWGNMFFSHPECQTLIEQMG